ncbi:MAG: hypothetical protein M3032_01825 [Verrucomicrobiota bacterium]|nr:hypothetical protein [Verrucomicrobiota bacterium]
MAHAQRGDARDFARDVARLVDPTRDYDHGYRGDGENRGRIELDRLNGDIARLRRELGNTPDGRIRSRYRELRQQAERLNFDFNRGRIRSWEVRRRADEIRSQLYDLRRAANSRYGDRDRDRDRDRSRGRR